MRIRWRKFAMTKQKAEKSEILRAVHETAEDFHRLGFIDKRKMRKFDLICAQPIPVYAPEQIRAIRDSYKLSQTVLASVLNTSVSTVRQWESGDKRPSGSSLKLLNLLERKGLEAIL
jgi:putative transcriptional regulator